METQQSLEVPSPKPNTEPASTPQNPYPTTFIQADTSSFKQVVQLLTGSSDTAANAATSAPKTPVPAKTTTGPKKQPFKLYERRNSLKNLNIISPLIPTFQNPKQPEILSPSILDFPSLVLSPVTPLIPDPFNRAVIGPARAHNMAAEEKAIAEKGFYLHPSPRSAEPPRLLPLFPVTSPRNQSSSP